MRTIPSAVQTLLKSRSMIGANKPSYEVTVEGMTGDGVLADEESWSPSRNVLNYVRGNVAATSDGKAIVSYVDGTDVKIAFADTVSGLLDGTKTFGASTTIKSGANNARSSINLIDGVLYLAISYTDTVLRAELWTDEAGLGTNFSKKSDISTKLNDNGVTLRAGAALTTVLKLGNENLVIITPWLTDMYGVTTDGQQAHYSTDGGTTWANGAKHTHGLMSVDYWNAAGSVLPIADDTFLSTYMTGAADNYLYIWSGSGASVGSATPWTGSWPIAATASKGESFFKIGDTLYLRYVGKIYKYTGATPITADLAAAFANWTQIVTVTGDVDHNSSTIFCGGYALSTSVSTDVNSKMYIIGSEAEPGATLPVKSISISRNKNTAGQLTLVVPNTAGEWAPDGTTHPNILWPNKQIGLWQGYGAELVKTFTGTIDSIALSTFPQELTLNLRDHLKYALDQIVTSGSSHVLTYTAQTIEAIVTDLVSKASMTAGTIHATGITIATKTFSWCTYADAIQELAELAGGWEYGCDEDGLFYFRRDSNVSPLAKGWTLTFTDGAAQTLYYPIITDSDKIYSGATVYVKDTDYSIDYDTGAITSITIADGSVTMDYAYISYNLAEGEDIISLGYTLDDEAAYYKVAVYGQAADGHVVFASADFASRTYYNVLPQKFMKIDAGESAQTVAECQALADQAIRLMESRIRICTFAAVAVPWLQVGDFIRVTETSSTISEIYRITDLSTNMDDSGYTMSITCFHHSA